MTEVELLTQLSGQLQDCLLVLVGAFVVAVLRLGMLAFIAGNQR